MEELYKLNQLAAKIGSDPTLIQGAGGNVSLKVNNKFFVKASGVWLSDALVKDIFVSMSLQEAREGLAANQLAEVKFDSIGGINNRPSIETSLHLLMPHRVVLHLHCVNTISLAVRNNARDLLEDLLSDFQWEFVPYVKPGEDLTRSVKEVLNKKSVNVLVLGNHGLVIGDDDVESADKLLKNVTHKLKQYNFSSLSINKNDLSFTDIPNGWRLPKYPEIQELAFDKERAEMVASGSLYPDHVVFLGKGVGLNGNHTKTKIGIPKVQIYKNKYVLVKDGLDAGAEEMVRALALIVFRIPLGSDIRYLTSEEEDELLDWDAEKYRQSLVKR